MEDAPVPWWRQMIRYAGVCMVEAALAALLIYLHLMVVVPATSREGSAGAACGLLVMLILAPGLWLAMVILFIALKAVVVLLPHARRHWALAVYWGVTLGAFAYQWARHPPTRVPPGDLWREVVFVGGLFVIPSLVLTLSHFVLIPRVAPGGSAWQALRALVRRAPPQG
ncbi:MAG: hypothetical protein R3A52_09630 [Polyangiales bacterium]